MAAAAAAGSGYSSWRFGALESGKLCAGALCCHAEVAAGSAAGYALAVLDGIDADGSEASWAAQACAVLPCAYPSERCLQYASPRASSSSSSLLALRLRLSGADSATAFFPELLAHSAAQEQQMLRPGDGSSAGTFAFATDGAGGAWLNASAAATGGDGVQLASAVLYGRRFGKDQLPYRCG